MWEHLDFNLDDQHLSDLRGRRAIAHAIDRQAIADPLYQGWCQVAHSWLPSRHPAYNERVRRYSYDPRQSRELLAAAGYLLGPDGVLRDARGERLSLRLLTTVPSVNGRWSASGSRQRVAGMMAQQLGLVGIDLEPEAVAADEAFRRFRSRAFPQLAMFAGSI